MSKLKIIFRKRLERIREDLNEYIEYRSSVAEKKITVPIPQMVLPEKNEDSVQETLPQAPTLQKQSLQGLSMQRPLQKPKMPVHSDALQGMSTHASSSPVSGGGAMSSHVSIPQFMMKSENRPDLDSILKNKEESFSERLLRLIDEKGLRDSDVYKRADIDRRLFSKIRADAEYTPSKKTAISFCLALGLDMDEAKALLDTAGYTLSASSRFDLIIMYLIEHCEYNINFANMVLYDYGEGTLSR